jgi:hypothetical protein
VGARQPGGFAQERQIGGVGLTIFAERSFRGRSATLREDTPNLQTIGLNDASSSLQVGPGEQWEVCEHANYQAAVLSYPPPKAISVEADGTT